MMTVNNTTAGVLRYGNGFTQNFDFSFEAQDASHVRVAQVLGTAIVDLNPLNYSVSLTPPGGTVTLNYIPDNTVTLYIYRKTPRDQLVSVSAQSRYDPEVTEEVWDKLTLAAQEMQAELDRAVKTVPGQDPQALLTAVALSEQNAVAAASAAASSASAAAASATAASADATQTAADRVQTGLDRAQTGLDRAQTTADAASAAASATTATTKATEAANSANSAYANVLVTNGDVTLTQANATSAANSATLAAGHAATATTKAVEAAASATAAAASAAEAAAYVPTIATQAEAQAGTDNTKLMTPLRVRESLNASGSAPIYACRAWVNFDGVGTATIRASGNVSSVVRNGVGDYTINFATPMPDANYTVAVSSGSNSTAPVAFVADNATGRTASAVRIRTVSTAFSLTDSAYVSVMIFR